MSDFILFWFAKPIAELVLLVVLLAVIGLFYAIAQIPVVWRQARCNHPRVHETSACDAICAECGKNLGFIGAWRESTVSAPPPATGSTT